MGTKLQHKQQIDHNIDFINKLDCDAFKDWAITAYFYCCVHMVESMLFDTYENHHTERHSDRFKVINGSEKYKEFRCEYKELYDLSVMARYKCITPYNADICEAQDYFEHIKKCIPY